MQSENVKSVILPTSKRVIANPEDAITKTFFFFKNSVSVNANEMRKVLPVHMSIPKKDKSIIYFYSVGSTIASYVIFCLRTDLEIFD